MGKCYLQLGRKEEARLWLTKAAEHKSEVADDLEVRGLLYTKDLWESLTFSSSSLIQTAEEAKGLLSKL